MLPSILTDLELAHYLADRAGDTILPHFRHTKEFKNKSKNGFDPVTIADQSAENTIRKIVSEFRPNDGFWGEEFGRTAGPSGRSWIVDPIDGTRGFISGTPTWGTLISLVEENGRPTLGIIDQSFIGERFWGNPDGAYYRGPRGILRLITKESQSLNETILFSTFPEIGREIDHEGFTAVAKHVHMTRYGMDCYAYGLLALGQIDLVIEAGLYAYDICAPIAVIEAAGGIVTDWNGQSAYGGGQVLAAGNSIIHEQALDILRDYADPIII
ncbi:MAG: inositol monophosphatase family protein [Aestuariivita sp.]|nr:inositol monophosphatase family protein [Aestuariivita sp.]